MWTLMFQGFILGSFSYCIMSANLKAFKYLYSGDCQIYSCSIDSPHDFHTHMSVYSTDYLESSFRKVIGVHIYFTYLQEDTWLAPSIPSVHSWSVLTYGISICVWHKLSWIYLFMYCSQKIHFLVSTSKIFHKWAHFLPSSLILLYTHYLLLN